MSNNYKYMDSDYIYTDQKTGVLRNLADITEEDVLLFAESSDVTKRAKDLYENSIKINNVASIFAVHKHLF
jgi:cell filamentation protein